MFDRFRHNLNTKKIEKVKSQDKKGQGLVEFALILPILLLVILGIIEGAWLIWGYITVQNAAREATRYAVTGAPLDTQGNPWTADDADRVEAIKQVARESAHGLPIDVYADQNESQFNAEYETPRTLGILVRGQTSPDDIEGTVNNPGLKGLNVMVEVYYNANMLDPLYSVVMGGNAIHLTGKAVLQNEGVNLALGGEVPSFAPPGGDTVAGGSAELDEVLEVWLDGAPEVNIPAGSDVDLLLNRHAGNKSYYVCFDGVTVPQSPVTTNASGTAWIMGHTIPLATSTGAHTFVSSLNSDCSQPAAFATINVLDPTNPAVGISDVPHQSHDWPDNSLVQVFVSAHDPNTSYPIYFDSGLMPDGYGGNCVITTDANKTGLATCAIPDGKVAGTYVMSTTYASSTVEVINASLEVREGYDLTDKSTVHIILDEHAPEHVYRVYFESGEVLDSQPSGVTTNSDGEKEVAFFIPAGTSGSFTLQTQDADSPLPPSTVRQIASVPITVSVPTGPMIVAPDEAPAGEVILIDLRNHSPGATYEVKFDQVIAGTELADPDGDVIQRIYYRIPSDIQGTKAITSFLQGSTSYSATHLIEVLPSPYITIEGGDTHVLGETITIYLKNHLARTAYDVYLDLDGNAGNGAETQIASGIVTDGSGNYTLTYTLPSDTSLPDSNPHLLESRREGNQVAFTNLNVIIADLQVTAITPPSNPQVGADLPVAVSVTNNQAVTITSFPFDNDFYLNRTPGYSNTLPPGDEKIWITTIGANETKIITPVVNLYNQGTYTLSARTDTTNNVIETLENNNIFSTTMTLPGCTLTPFVDNFQTGAINTVLKTPPDTVLDKFSSNSFSNNHGTVNWANNWQEINESNGAGSGYVRVTGGELRLRRPNYGASRRANLSSAVNPTFSFNYRTSNNLEYNDIVVVEVSSDGSAWTELDRFEDDGSGSRSFDISAYATVNTTIRFKVENNVNGTSEYFYADNVQISYSQAVPASWTLTAFGNAAPLPPLASLQQEPAELLAMRIVNPASLNLVGPPPLPVLQATPQPATVAAETAGASSNAYSVQPAIATSGQTAPELEVAPHAASLAASLESGVDEIPAPVYVDSAMWLPVGPPAPSGYQMAVRPASLAVTAENEDSIAQPPPVVAGVEAAAIPLQATTVYNFAGVTQATCAANGICAYENDVDRFPYRRSSHKNYTEQATNGEYANIGADNTNYWRTRDPGSRDEIFVQFDMIIDEDIGTITNIDLTFKGYTRPTNRWTTHRIYVLKTGQDPYQESSWVQVGSESLRYNRDTSMTKSITANFADYIDPVTGAITWGVYETRNSERMYIYYAEMAVTAIDNDPPDPPGNLQTDGQTAPGDVTNTAPDFSWTFSDPDVGDTQGSYQIQVDDNSDFSSPVWDSGQVNSSATTVGYGGPSLTYDGTTYYWRVWTWDDNNAQSTASSTQFTMHTNQAPSAINLLTDGRITPVAAVTDTLPNFSWTFSDPDAGDDQAKYQIQVDDNSDFSSPLWDSGQVNSSLLSAEYGGVALPLDGSVYYWRMWVWDDSNPQAQSGPSATQQFTMYTNQAPSAINLLTEGQATPVADVSDGLPDFSWGFNDPDGDSQSKYQIQVDDNSDFSSPVWDSGQVSSGDLFAEYGGTALLLDGSTYYWRMWVWDNSNPQAQSGPSATQQFTMSLNQPPTAGSLKTDGQPTPATNINDSTPRFSWIFNDPDGDSQGAYQIQVDDNSDFSSLLWDSGQVSSGALFADYGGAPLLLDGKTYYWRMWVWDDLVPPAQSSESVHQQFTMYTPPPFVAPTNLVVTATVDGGGLPITELSWQDNSTDEDRFRIERKKQGEPSFTVVATIDTSGDPTYTGQRTYTDTNLDCGEFTYTYKVVAVRDADSATAETNQDSDITDACPITPVPCTSGGESGGILTLCSAGTSTFQNDDDDTGANAGYLFMNQAITSWSFDMAVRLDSIPSMNGGSLAGLEVRDSLNGQAKKVELVVRGIPSQIGAWGRAADNSTVNQVVNWTSPGSGIPIWLRIVRANGQFFFYYSTGQERPVLGAWTSLGSTPDTMDEVVNVGLTNSSASATASASTWEQFSLGCTQLASSTCGVVKEDQGLVVVDAINYTDNFKSSTSDDKWAPKSSTSGNYAAMSYTGADYTGVIYTDAPMLEYSVNIETEGDYYVWIYGYNSGSSSDSVHVGLNGVPSTKSDKINAGQTGLRWFNNTADSERAYIPNLTQGIHTLNVWGREDGFELIQILLATDPDYTPDGGGNTPENQSDCLEPVPPDFPPNLTQCNDVLRNTSFEDSNDIHNALKTIWEVPNTSGTQATNGPPYALDSGSRSIRLPSGWPPYPQVETEKNAPYLYQTFEMPTWLNAGSSGSLTLQKAVTRQGARDDDDRLYFILRDENGVPLTTPMAIAHGAEDPDAGSDGPVAVNEWVQYPNSDSYSIVTQDNNIFSHFIGDPQDVAGKTVQAYFYQPNSPGDSNYPASTTFFVDTVELRICTTQPEPPAQSGQGSIKGLLSVQLGTGPTPVEGVSVWAYKMDGDGGPLQTTYTVNAGYGQPNYGFYNLEPGIYQVYAQFVQDGGILYDFGYSVSVVADSTATLNLLLEMSASP